MKTEESLQGLTCTKIDPTGVIRASGLDAWLSQNLKKSQIILIPSKQSKPRKSKKSATRARECLRDSVSCPFLPGFSPEEVRAIQETLQKQNDNKEVDHDT